MKAKHINKLRKEVANMGMYSVVESEGLFGNFPYYLHYCDQPPFQTLAKDSIHAVERYQRWYFRKHKRRPRHWCNTVSEVSRTFAKYMVVDYKGYYRYYM